MDYNKWIRRERRIRLTLLKGSPVILQRRICHLCADCGEVCLCHEEACPNCNSAKIVEEKLVDVEAEVLSGERIRCKFRFSQLA